MLRQVLGVVGIASVLLAAPLSAAGAADMSVPPYLPPAAASYNWTGCYIGANVGSGSVNISQTQAFSTNNFGSQIDGGLIGGGQVGCDYQWNQFVFGVKGQFDAGNLSGATNVIPAFPTFYSQDSFNNIGTLTGRLGFASTPGLLLYVDGGGAWVRDSLAVYGTIPTNFLSETATTILSGYDIGGGLEYKLAPNWSVFAEYDYLGFGTRNISYVAAPGTVGAPNTLTTKEYAQTVTVGVNWRFNWLAR